MNISWFGLIKSKLFKGGANEGSQNDTRPKSHSIIKEIKFEKRTDYADFVLAGNGNPYTTAVLKEIVSNVVGGAGINVAPTPLLDSGDVDTEMQQQLVKLWSEYKDKIDAGNRHSWSAFNRIIATELFGGGEAFIVRCDSKDIHNKLNRGYMVFGYNAVPFESKGEYKDGIKTNVFGKAQSYLFANGNKSKPLDAALVIHAASYVRAADTRGYSELAPACDLSVNISQYDKDTSKLVAASQRMAFSVISDTKPEYPAEIPVIWTKGNKTEVDVKALSSSLVDAFSKEHRDNMLYALCAACSTGFGAVTGKFNGSYSASRQEMILAAQRDLARQEQFIDSVVKPIYHDFIIKCMNKKLITYEAGNIFNARYVAPSKPHIDPLKAAKAVALELATNQTSLSEVLASKGKDFDSYIIHLKNELLKLKDAGLQPNGIEALKWLELHADNDEPEAA